MNGRLIVAIISTIFEETVIAVIVLWAFPRWGTRAPLWLLAIAMFAWAGFSVWVYEKGTHALKLKQIIGLHNMIGSKGEAVSRLDPGGMVIIKGELWRARSGEGVVEEGTEIIVTGQDRLELMVVPDEPAKMPD